MSGGRGSQCSAAANASGARIGRSDEENLAEVKDKVIEIRVNVPRAMGLPKNMSYNTFIKYKVGLLAAHPPTHANGSLRLPVSSSWTRASRAPSPWPPPTPTP